MPCRQRRHGKERGDIQSRSAAALDLVLSPFSTLVAKHTAHILAPLLHLICCIVYRPPCPVSVLLPAGHLAARLVDGIICSLAGLVREAALVSLLSLAALALLTPLGLILLAAHLPLL